MNALSQTFLTYRGRNLSKSENPDLEGKKTLWKNSWKDLKEVRHSNKIKKKSYWKERDG